jgi:hypothetical protein
MEVITERAAGLDVHQVFTHVPTALIGLGFTQSA